MKERPILFSTPMVRAILEGRKSQTRRIMKPQPEYSEGMSKWVLYPKQHPTVYADLINAYKYCPYGQVGDILWVRETWAYRRPIDAEQDWCSYYYYATDYDEYVDRWKPSIFMPKEASRLKLKVTNIRVERIQGISYEDAVLEGIESSNEFQSNEGYLHQYKDYIVDDFALDAVDSYHTLWESINGKYSWQSNPWVWVIEFERIK